MAFEELASAASQHQPNGTALPTSARLARGFYRASSTRDGLRRSLSLLVGERTRHNRARGTPRPCVLRGLAVGRKNHYGSLARRRTEVAAPLDVHCETAKLVAVDPRTYLRVPLHGHRSARHVSYPEDLLGA